MSEISKYDAKRDAFMEEMERLRPDLFYSDVWSDEERRLAIEELRPTKTKTNMVANIPMLCHAEACHFAPSCPLVENGTAPKGKKCPIELSAAIQFFSDYVEELNVDVTRMVEVSIVRDLVDQEIQQMRKTWLLSQEHFIQEVVAGIDEKGNVVTSKDLHKAIDYEDKILKRKERLRNSLLATRESKAKAGKTAVDGAQVVANLLRDVRQIDEEREMALRKRLGMGEDDVFEAELVEDEDDS